VPVISGHALLGVSGLVVWLLYRLQDERRLALITVADLGVVAILGLAMAARWISVYRRYAPPASSRARLVTVRGNARSSGREVTKVHDHLHSPNRPEFERTS
jgi:hypothetical protein